jgi:hypothetical protein
LRRQLEKTSRDVSCESLTNLGLDAETSQLIVDGTLYRPSLDETIKATLKERIEFRKDRQVLWRKKRKRWSSRRLNDCWSHRASRLPRHLRQDGSFIPHTFDALKNVSLSMKVSVFQSMINWEGHHSTRSESYGESGMDKLAAKTGDGGAGMDIYSTEHQNCAML